MTQAEVERPGGRAFRLELILLAAGFLGLWVFLAVFGGGPIYSDELLYMNAGLNNLRDPFILNRYTHVFLQKPFLELAPTPLQGANIYWGFLIAATAALVYWNARTLQRGSHILHAGLAALIFLSFRFISEYAGVTIVDFTTMLVGMAFITVYLSAARQDFRSKWLLAVLGLLFFVGFKSKEAMLPFGILLLGVGYNPEGAYRVSALWQRFKWCLVGILSGVVLFVLLNGILLKDPFFGLSPTSLREFYSQYIGLSLTTFTPPTQDWLVSVIASLWLVPFLLYLMSGVTAQWDDQFTPALRLVWLAPLALLLFLVGMMARNFYEPSPRYFFPALPVISFLAPQYLKIAAPQSKAERWRWWAAVGAALGVTFALPYGLKHLAGRLGWDPGAFLEVILLPAAVTLLIVPALVLRRTGRWSVLLPVALIFFICVYPLRMNIKYLVVLHPNRDAVEERFYPFYTFAGKIPASAEMQIYVSSQIYDDLGMLTTDKKELAAMYNVYYKANADKSNFAVSSAPGSLLADLQQADYNAALLTDADWNSLAGNPAGFAWVQGHYTFLEDEAEPLVLLLRK